MILMNPFISISGIEIYKVFGLTHIFSRDLPDTLASTVGDLSCCWPGVISDLFEQSTQLSQPQTSLSN